MSSKATELRIACTAFGLLAVLFIVWPELDLLVSGLFYRGDGHWALNREDLWLAIPYRGLPWLGQSLLLTLFTLWLLSFWSRLPKLRVRRVIFGFLLSAALIGPIILVDATLKEHSGRTRPVNIEQFGGSLKFTGAFKLADQCEQNCSFVSGHVATAAFIMAFGWLGSPVVRRRWLMASIAFAGLFALVRMVPGGHFLSDTIFAWFATYFSMWFTEWGFRKLGWLPHSD